MLLDFISRDISIYQFTPSFYSIAMCHDDVTYETKGTYTWPETVHYNEAVLDCVRGVNSIVTRSCVLDGEGRAVWELPNTDRCAMVVICVVATPQSKIAQHNVMQFSIATISVVTTIVHE